jgi:hypothetical protein
MREKLETENHIMHPDGRPRFKPGHHVGRPKGTKDHWTRDLKKAAVEGASRHGYDGKGEGGIVGYMQFLSEKYPRAMAGLLGKLMPLQVTGDVRVGVATVQVSPVPTGHYLTAEEIKRLEPRAEDIVADVEQAIEDAAAERDEAEVMKSLKDLNDDGDDNDDE